MFGPPFFTPPFHRRLPPPYYNPPIPNSVPTTEHTTRQQPQPHSSPVTNHKLENSIFCIFSIQKT